MGSGFKDRPSVAKNRQKPSKIRCMATLSRIIKSALEPTSDTNIGTQGGSSHAMRNELSQASN